MKKVNYDCGLNMCHYCPFCYRNNGFSSCADLTKEQVINLAEKYIKEFKYNVQIGDIIKAKLTIISPSYFIVKRIGKFLDDNTKFYECDLLNSDGCYNPFTVMDNDIIQVFSKQ